MKSMRLLASAFVASALISSGASALESTKPGEAVVRLGPDGPPSVVQPPAGYSAKRRTATFIVTYAGFSDAAKTAFQRAVDIWSTEIVSPVPIRVRAQWSNLGSTGILGSAGPVAFFKCASGSGCPPGVAGGTLYPVALINKRYGRDMQTSIGDINASFNNAFADWHFGSGNAPAGKVDFTSVALHELGLGLGFIGSGKLVNGNTQGTVRGLYDYLYMPTHFDRFIVNSANKHLIDLNTFPDPSAALKTQFVSNNLYFRLLSGARFRIFAPNPFQPGSSYSHLDETTYPKGNANSLMTPSISRGETIRNPGPITLTMLRNMGWN